MRPQIENPVNPERLTETTQLAEYIYAAYENGDSCDTVRKDLTRLAGRLVSTAEIVAAFGSVRPRSFAYDLLWSKSQIPTDLTDTEMLEIIGLLLSAPDGLRERFWLACLAENTGDQGVSDLIYWPNIHFGDNSPEPSAAEVLAAAKVRGHTRVVGELALQVQHR